MRRRVRRRLRRGRRRGRRGRRPARPAIPAQQEADLKKAAAAAGCKLVDAENEGAGHEEKDFKASDYKQNPPTSGAHFPTWYEDGIYNAGDTPELGRLVHTLEHGRINIQYKPGTPATTVAQLETLVKETRRRLPHAAVREHDQDAVRRRRDRLGPPARLPDDEHKVFDAIRAFRTEYIDKGPEVVP